MCNLYSICFEIKNKNKIVINIIIILLSERSCMEFDEFYKETIFFMYICMYVHSRAGAITS